MITIFKKDVLLLFLKSLNLLNIVLKSFNAE